MASPKEQLVELIDAYAAAKASNNNYLATHMSKTLGEFLNSIDVVAPVEVPEELLGAKSAS